MTTERKSEVSHTPGPWEVQQNARLEIVSTVAPFVGCDWKQGVAHVYRAGRMNGTAYHMPAVDNARLIAASPDLLEACELALKAFDYCEQGGIALERLAIETLRAAITKAKGRDAKGSPSAARKRL